MKKCIFNFSGFYFILLFLYILTLSLLSMNDNNGYFRKQFQEFKGTQSFRGCSDRVVGRVLGSNPARESGMFYYNR